VPTYKLKFCGTPDDVIGDPRFFLRRVMRARKLLRLTRLTVRFFLISGQQPSSLGDLLPKNWSRSYESL
jgi:hypothetical protein